MTPRLLKLTLFCFGAAVLGLLTIPSLVRTARLNRDIRALKAEIVPANVLRDGGYPMRDYVPVDRDDLTRRLIATVAGDSPEQLGDLKLETMPAEIAPGLVPFTLEGDASFSQAYSTLEHLRRLWPAVRIADLELSAKPEGPGLHVALRGSLAVPGYVPAIVALGEPAAPSRTPARDPFRFGHAGRSADPSGSGSLSPATVSPPAGDLPFQGTGVLGGVPVAFFGGQAYRVGDVVAGRRLVAIEEGRARFAPAEDES